MNGESLLSVSLSVDYAGRRDVLREAAFAVEPGEIFGLVGQSGSGKSTVILSVLKLLQYKGGTARGTIHFLGRDLMRSSERDMRQIRGREIGFIPQSPVAALNPALRLSVQFEQFWRLHAGASKAAMEQRLLPLLGQVGLPADQAFRQRYPRELSVGQAQRVLIAMAVMHRPRLLIADEPTSSLDAITTSEVLKLLLDLNRQLGMGILFISHDLLSVASFCHRIAILHEGQIVECETPELLFRRPRHPYSQRLLAAIPRLSLEDPAPVLA